MAIGPKEPKPTAREEREAYEIATLRDLDTCQRCRRNCGQGFTSRDHRKGRGVGGLTLASNLQVLGGTGTLGCHGWKTENPAAAIEEGWAVPGYAKPAEWPARRWFHTMAGILALGWCLYSDDGQITRITEEEARQRMEGKT